MKIARQVENVAQEQRRIGGKIEARGSRLSGLGVGRAEEASVEDFRRQGGAVEREQRSGRARASLLDDASDQALAGSRLADDQNGDVGRGGGGNLIEQAAMSRAETDERIKGMAIDQARRRASSSA